MNLSVSADGEGTIHIACMAHFHHLIQLMSEDNSTDNVPIETYESISTKVFEEERRLSNLKSVNLLQIPQRPKKSPCSLPINSNAMKFFKSKTLNQSMTFETYIHERRENTTSTQAVLQQCSQLISFLKMKIKEI